MTQTVSTENGILFPEPTPEGYTCKRCKEHGLVWGCLPEGDWRLFTKDHKPHTCKTKETK